MTMMVHLLRLHISRIFRSGVFLGFTLAVPILAIVFRLLGAQTSIWTILAVFLACGAIITSVQTLLDRESGLAAGIRTTRAAYKHIVLSRAVLIPIIVIAQSLFYGIVSSIISAIK